VIKPTKCVIKSNLQTITNVLTTITKLIFRIQEEKTRKIKEVSSR